MPFWPFRRQQRFPYIANPPPAQELEERASRAFFAKRWAEAERLYREIIAKSDAEGRQVARNMLGQALEKQKREGEAIPVYEQNVAEGSSFPYAHERLAIIYHRLGQPDDERRVLLAGIQATTSDRARQWFQGRLRKMN